MAECCDPLFSQNFDSMTMPDFNIMPGCQGFDKTTFLGSAFQNFSGEINTMSAPDNGRDLRSCVSPKPDKQLPCINHAAHSMVTIPLQVNSNDIYYCNEVQAPHGYSSAYQQPSLEPCQRSFLNLPAQDQPGYYMQGSRSSSLGSSSLSQSSDELAGTDSIIPNHNNYYVQTTQFKEELLDWISDARVSSIGGMPFTSPDDPTPRIAKMTRSLSAPMRSSRMMFNPSHSFVVDDYSYLPASKADTRANISGSPRLSPSPLSPLKRSLEANASSNRAAAVHLESQTQGISTEGSFQQAFSPSASWIRSSINEGKLLSDNKKESFQASASPRQQSLRRCAVLNKSLSGSALLQPKGYVPPPTISEATPFPHFYVGSNISPLMLPNSTSLQSPMSDHEKHDEATKPDISGLRRSRSADDLQNLSGAQTNSAGSSPLTVDSANSDVDGSVKIGRYTMEERKIRICRYRQKRTERNYDKKIKYNCRKILADNRLRVKGRFAKTEVFEDLQEKLHPNRQDCEDQAASEAFADGETSRFCYQYAFGVDLSEIWKLPLSAYVQI